MTMPPASTHPNWRAAQEARTGGRAVLARALSDSRARTLALFDACEAALRPAHMAVPYDVTLNPPLWELGHIGWFQEWWLARNPQRAAGVQADPLCPRPPSRLAGADALYNSSEVPHPTRWYLPLPDAQATRAYLAATLDNTLQRLANADETDDALYFYRLALFHEDMHAEAAVYMAQALGVALPGEVAFPGRSEVAGFPPPGASLASPWAADAGQAGAVCRMPDCRWTLGSAAAGGFVFDNELGAQALALAAFEIDAAPVTWVRYLPFVEAGGYRDARWWSPEGWQWLQGAAQRAPLCGPPTGEGATGGGLGLPRDLRRDAGQWVQRQFDRWQPLDLQAPAVHLSAFEADAWCRWAGRRLPTEAEWECAAMTDPPSLQPPFHWGRVWEWTASGFAPFPDFVPHPYRDYSAPWFGTRRVLRGASTATSPRMAHPKYRNFFTPERNDIFAGFRSCAVDSSR
jgi:gamma-glutamyl hercynylcysteine S-oxide synthase